LRITLYSDIFHTVVQVGKSGNVASNFTRLLRMTPQELAGYFKEPLCIFDLKADNKRDALAEMIDIVCDQHNLKDRDIILEMLLNRESLGSTAIGKGVAFPHGFGCLTWFRGVVTEPSSVAKGVQPTGLHLAGCGGSERAAD